MRAFVRVSLGSNGEIYYDGITGKTFAQYLNAGYTFKLAWYYGLAASSAKNDVSVIFTGSSESNCNSRRDGMTWNNFKDSAYGRITNPPWMCAATWNDV